MAHLKNFSLNVTFKKKTVSCSENPRFASPEPPGTRYAVRGIGTWRAKNYAFPKIKFLLAMGALILVVTFRHLPYVLLRPEQ